MTARLTSDVLVGALRRRIAAAGGFVTIVARGDATAGAILVLAHHNGRNPVVLERRIGMDDRYVMAVSGPQNAEKLEDIERYAQTRRVQDRDLWVIEANVAQAERFAAETIADG